MAGMERARIGKRGLFSFSYTRALLLFFVLSLPFVNPWIHGDGVGYYAYAHSLLIDHNLQFESSWRAGNELFLQGRVGPDGTILPEQYTATHHLDNHFSVGPAILWAPFLIVAHAVILMLNRLGAHIATNGFSRPYLIAMALATACYGFVGLFLSFCVARRYVAEHWAFLATVGYWLASSLPVYMYLNPSWPHALSLFAVAFFLWYWHRTREQRGWSQWGALGLLGALMVNVYYLNGILLLVPALEALWEYGACAKKLRKTGIPFRRLITSHFIFAIMFLVGMLPTFITREIIYGSFLATGYPSVGEWRWGHPLFWTVLFSSDHGLLSWTPILVFGIAGIVLFRRYDRAFALYLWAACLGFWYVISCYVNWDGISSFGNRFFLSLGSIFILGLAVLFDRACNWRKREKTGFFVASAALMLFVVWNIGFIFQWGDHLIPVRGPISWRTMTYNQVRVVPQELWGTGEAFLFSRKRFMHQIEQKDIKQIQKDAPGNSRP